MDFNFWIFGILASFLIVLRRTVYLVYAPYQTMRRIAADEDLTQIGVIFFFVVTFYLTANHFRAYAYSPLFLSLLALFHFLLTAGFFALFRIMTTKEHVVNVYPFLMLFAYTLIPTLVWFMVNAFLYVLLPPPRTPSLMGKGFSLIYLSFSLVMLLWKMILTYLAVRFATGFPFFRIVYSLMLYLAVVIPYALLLYVIGASRIPFL